MKAKEMFEKLGFERQEDEDSIDYLDNLNGRSSFRFRKDECNRVYIFAYNATSEELKACLKQMGEIQKELFKKWEEEENQYQKKCVSKCI